MARHVPAKRSIATAEDAARVFSAVSPKLGVIYDYYDKEGLGEAVRAGYKGQFVVGQDLMRIEIGRTVTWHSSGARFSADQPAKTGRAIVRD